jgi:hypothetical protein
MRDRMTLLCLPADAQSFIRRRPDGGGRKLREGYSSLQTEAIPLRRLLGAFPFVRSEFMPLSRRIDPNCEKLRVEGVIVCSPIGSNGGVAVHDGREALAAETKPDQAIGCIGKRLMMRCFPEAL